MTHPDPYVVVITGASSGIGRATAQAFARRGAFLVLAARDSHALEMVAAECRALGTHARAVPTDVTDHEAVQSLARTALTRYGQIDLWFNNVGIGTIGRFEDTPMVSHRRVIEANLLGHMHGAHAVLPHFRERGRGTLVNMISLGGWVSAPYAGSYVASKFGLHGLSESLRAEVSDLPDVHVCAVYPTFVDTPGVRHGANYSGRSVRPPPPLVDPREVAAAVVALAQRPRAVVTLGVQAVPGRLAHALAPTLLGRASRWLMDRAFARADKVPHTDGNLFLSSAGHSIDGGFRQGRAAPRLLLGIAAVGLLAWTARRGSAKRGAGRP